MFSLKFTVNNIIFRKLPSFILPQQRCYHAKNKLNILFYGNTSFSLSTLSELNTLRLTNELIENIEVVCVKGKSPIRTFAQQHNLTIHEWKNQVSPDTYDVGVVVSFGHLIPSSAIRACKYGMLNAHPSLLPKWRGAAPIMHTIWNNETTTGITIMEVAPKRFDVGRILLQKELCVPPRYSSHQLLSLLAPEAAQMMVEALRDLPSSLEDSIPQEGESSHAFKITPEMGQLNWTTSTCTQIDCQYRAMENIVKLYSGWQGKQLRLVDIICPKQSEALNLPSLAGSDRRPGYIFFHRKRRWLCIKCKEGWASFQSLQLAGKKLMSASEFNNGFVYHVPEEERYLTFLQEDTSTNKQPQIVENK